jgi:hypothetical protein
MAWLLEAAIVPLFLSVLLADPTAEPHAQFPSGVNLVEVYATVTDRQGDPIVGLTAANFQIAEDGAGQAAGVRGVCGGDRRALVLRPGSARAHHDVTTIARELRFQYLLGYVPSRARSTEASWHAIDVTVGRPDVRVRARDGYVGR